MVAAYKPREEAPEWNLPCRHLDWRLPPFRTVRKKFLFKSATLWNFHYGTPAGRLSLENNCPGRWTPASGIIVSRLVVQASKCLVKYRLCFRCRRSGGAWGVAFPASPPGVPVLLVWATLGKPPPGRVLRSFQAPAGQAQEGIPSPLTTDAS